MTPISSCTQLEPHYLWKLEMRKLNRQALMNEFKYMNKRHSYDSKV